MATYNPGGGGTVTEITNGGGTVSVDSDGTINVTAATGKPVNLAGSSLALQADVSDPDTAISKAVDGYSFLVGALGSEVEVLAITPAGLELFGNPFSGGGGSWVRKTANYTAVSGDQILADTTGGSFSITLPSVTAAGDFLWIQVRDVGGGGGVLTIVGGPDYQPGTLVLYQSPGGGTWSATVYFDVTQSFNPANPGPIGATPSTGAFTILGGTTVKVLSGFGASFDLSISRDGPGNFQFIAAQGGNGYLFYTAGGTETLGGFLSGAVRVGPATTDGILLKQASGVLTVRNGDDSAAGFEKSKQTTDTSATTGLLAGAFAATTTSTLTFYDSTGQAYDVPALIRA